MKVITTILASNLVITAAPALAQKQVSAYDPGIRATTPESLRREADAEAAWFSHLEFLASDELNGRRTGTQDFLHAVEYVESQFKSVGLKPAGTYGYRQAVGFKSISTDSAASSFEVVKAGEITKLAVGSDVVLSPHVDAGSPIDAPAVFAGYGFAVKSVGFDDISGTDLKGKIAVVLAGSPPSVHGPLRAYFRTPAERWKALKAAGAIGVITIAEPRQRLGGAATERAVARPQVLLSDPAVDALRGLRLSATISPEVANSFFSGSPHQLDELLELAKDGRDLPKFVLPLVVRANTVVHQQSSFDAPNVVGILPGSDSVLKKEYVVLSAHLDHLGEGRPQNGDAIYNGAMDNAAGIASLIEVSKALAKAPPKRSIVFLALTGEEEGELGSQYFAHYPTVTRKQIVVNLNMDMYLPLFPLHFLEVQGLGESTLGNDARAAAQLNDIEVQFDKQPDENRFIRSDQASFVKYGIPGLAFKFGWLPDTPEQKTFTDWIKNRYHHANDDLNQPIDKAAAVRFDQVLLTLTRRVANRPTRPSWYPESFFSTLPRT